MEYFSHYAVATVDLRRYSGARKWEGRFARVHEIEMFNEGKWVKAVVKTMVQPLTTDDSLIQLTEVDSLRKPRRLGSEEKTNCTMRKSTELEQNGAEEILFKHNVRVLAGLTHVHAEGYLHRDLKMSNVLVKNEVAKISDAGLLQLNGHTFTASCMTIPTTVAPEVFKNKYCDDAESDVYSIGILMWELYYCRPAFTSICQETSSVEQMEEYKPDVTDVTEFIGRIQKGLRPVFDKHQPVPKLVDLMTKCWSADMIKRPTANMVLIELENLI
ncbi:unnamed protein product [Mytilus edulis]|uniref:Protein kinase domain-containing protein n=1 Tax=Mytilus edulis TaxID=6550 RepID=A0A8S3U4W6_MYTED|nr:unnamed protein product [Mytilus edulis]